MVGASVFSECLSLETVDWSAASKTIPLETFYLCQALTEVRNIDQVNRIEGLAFSGCRSLKSFQFPNGVPEVGDSLFQGCSNLVDVSLPSELVMIGNAMFLDLFQ